MVDKIDWNDLTDAMSIGLKNALDAIITNTTDINLAAFTAEVVGDLAIIMAMEDGPEKNALLKEQRGTIAVIAEKHRITVSEETNKALIIAFDIVLGMLQRLAL